MSWCNFTMVKADNYTGMMAKKTDVVREKLKTSSKGPLRPGRKRIPRPKCCLHCDEKFHSNFCRKLILKNINSRRYISSKYQCLTCRKKFKGIANFLRHRTLHNELPQNEDSPDMLESLKPVSSVGHEAYELNNDLNFDRQSNSFNEFEYETQPKQYEEDVGIHGEKNFNNDFLKESNNKGIQQPTGARKRKGKLRIQYITPTSVADERVGEDEDTSYRHDLVEEENPVNDENDNPKVFIISGDSDLTLDVNGRLDESAESSEHALLYDKDASIASKHVGGRTSRGDSGAYDAATQCYCSACRNDNAHGSKHAPRYNHHHHHHDYDHHDEYRDDCANCKCSGHPPYKQHFTSCHCERCTEENCKKPSANCHQHCCSGHEDSMCGHSHRSHCCSRYDWNGSMLEDDGHRIRPKNPGLFDRLCSNAEERGGHFHSHTYDSYGDYMRSGSFSRPEPLPIDYSHTRPTSTAHRPSSKDPSTNAGYTGETGLKTSIRRRRRQPSESDLAPLDAFTLTDNVVSGFSHHHHHDHHHHHGSSLTAHAPALSNGDNNGSMQAKDIFTAPGSAIRRMKELVSKYSDRHKRSSPPDVTVAKSGDFMDPKDGCESMACLSEADHMVGDGKAEAYVCHICRKEFAWAVTLKRHMLIHTGVRQYQCNICSKAFTRSHHLKRHMTVHTGEKPYVCHICNKAYSRSDRLSSHMSNHEGYVANKKKGKLPKQTDAPVSIETSRHQQLGGGQGGAASNDAASGGVVAAASSGSFSKVIGELKVNVPVVSEVDHARRSKNETVPRIDEELKDASSNRLLPDQLKKSDAEDSGEYGQRSSSGLIGYSRGSFQKPEKDVIPSSRFQVRPSDFSPASLYVPSSYHLGHSPAFISGSMIAPSSIERPSEHGLYSPHGGAASSVKAESSLSKSRSPVAASEPLPSSSSSTRRGPRPILPDTGMSRRDGLSNMMEAREDFIGKQKRLSGGIPSIYFHDLHQQHSPSVRGAGGSGSGGALDPLVHYVGSSREEQRSMVPGGSDGHHSFMKFKREHVHGEKSNNSDSSMKEKADGGLHDEPGSTQQTGSSSLPGSSVIPPSLPGEAPEIQMNLFTFRHMVNHRHGRGLDDVAAVKKVLPRSFVCKTCNKGFTRSHHLRRHELIHSGHKPFKCTICGRAFNRSDHLNLHLATHYQGGNGGAPVTAAKERGKGKKKGMNSSTIAEATVSNNGDGQDGTVYSGVDVSEELANVQTVEEPGEKQVMTHQETLSSRRGDYQATGELQPELSRRTTEVHQSKNPDPDL
eukprot:gene12791-14102_t